VLSQRCSNLTLSVQSLSGLDFKHATIIPLDLSFAVA
jgi:hypothetical protein